MKQRNPAKRSSTAGIQGAGPSPKRSAVKGAATSLARREQKALELQRAVDAGLAPACLTCGRPMERRKKHGRYGPGAAFWGCTGYPYSCKATMSMIEWEWRFARFQETGVLPCKIDLRQYRRLPWAQLPRIGILH
jgi:hypothetical protein